MQLLKRLLNKIASPVVLAVAESIKHDAECWYLISSDEDKFVYIGHMSERFQVVLWISGDVDVLNADTKLPLLHIGMIESLILRKAIKSWMTLYNKSLVAKYAMMPMMPMKPKLR